MAKRWRAATVTEVLAGRNPLQKVTGCLHKTGIDSNSDGVTVTDTSAMGSLRPTLGSPVTAQRLELDGRGNRNRGTRVRDTYSDESVNRNF